MKIDADSHHLAHQQRIVPEYHVYCPVPLVCLVYLVELDQLDELDPGAMRGPAVLIKHRAGKPDVAVPWRIPGV